jgi:hypothetical protein
LITGKPVFPSEENTNLFLVRTAMRDNASRTHLWLVQAVIEKMIIIGASLE